LLDTLQLFFNGHWVEAFCRGDTGSVGPASFLYVIAIPCLYCTLLYLVCRARVELFRFELRTSVSDPKQKIAPLKRHTEDALTGQIWGQLDASSHEGLAKFDRVYVSVLDILPASRLLIKKADRVKVQRRIMPVLTQSTVLPQL